MNASETAIGASATTPSAASGVSRASSPSRRLRGACSVLEVDLLARRWNLVQKHAGIELGVLEHAARRRQVEGQTPFDAVRDGDEEGARVFAALGKALDG